VQTRDVIVIGASLGGVDALRRLARELPGELPAAICVVQHTSPDSPALLGRILDRQGPLPAVTAEPGMELVRGRIHVAPPDRHLIVTTAGIETTFGPRENRSRPAIDPLFRTAAVNLGSRVIGVVLTGLLGDGTAGLLAVSRCGGVPLVQDPDDAAFPEMPDNALRAVPDARRVRLDSLAATLVRLSGEAAPAAAPAPEALILEARLTERAMTSPDWNRVPGTPTDFTCPECRGALQQIDDGGHARYRCRVGHAYSPADLLSEKGKALEESLWVALQTLEERASMLEKLGEDDRHRGRRDGGNGFSGRAEELREHASRLRELLLLSTS
jgi:two-component system, chemotaxis family, protein-glutamate methylesterase/glutaminase